MNLRANESTTAAMALLATGVAFALPVAAVPLTGRVATPADAVPALTVHAWSRASGRTFSVTTAPGQTTYVLDVPAGRYVVFATPADPGAPPVSGAHTQFSVCARDAKKLESGACREHGLVDVDVGAKKVENVDVTDWFLDDAVIAQLDAALGRAAESADDVQLAAPKFSEYPAVRLAALPRAAALQPDADARLERDRVALVAALAGEPSFAGRFSIVRVPCADATRTDCEAAAVLDLALGRAAWPAPLNPLPAAGACGARGALQFRRDSRLMTISARDGEQAVTRYYVWDGEATRLTLVATLASAVGTRCSAPAVKPEGTPTSPAAPVPASPTTPASAPPAAAPPAPAATAPSAPAAR